MKKIGLISILVMISHPAFAADKCKPNLTEFDVCERAQKIVTQVRPRLPLTLSENVIMKDVSADGNKIIAQVRLGVTEEEMLATASETHTSIDVAKSRMAEITKNGLCANKNPLGSFIRLGGEMQYVYTYPSGTFFNAVTVSSCN
ncbi:hypothetical protein [Klebsiella michiganensis]|uniref:hypothetical protein n=1 Tax=Klebsiella michiganensis TaxID=1134687 RepID=UPI003F558CB6